MNVLTSWEGKSNVYILFCYFHADISSGFEGEVCEDDLRWLAQRLNKDVDKVARHLKVGQSEIDSIRQQGDRVETQNFRILRCWTTTTRNSGNIPTWKAIKDVLENEKVGRFDVIRARLNEEEIDDNVFLWLEPRVAASCDEYGRVLGLPDYEIDMIHSSVQNVRKRSRDILKRWRERTKRPRLEDLTQALESECLERFDLAKELREKFFKDN